MIKIDFHTHSNYSYDGVEGVEKLVEAARKRGLNGLCVCDHNTIAKKKERFKDFLVIYGQETSTKQGHVAVLGTNKVFEKGIDAVELVEKANDENAVTIATHPFAVRKSSLWQNIWKAKPTSAEKVNGSDFVSNIVSALALKTGTGGSDAHSSFEVGTGFAELECELNEESVLECVRKGRMKAKWAPRPSVYARILTRNIRKVLK
ncbi:PHP domain-containing protein [Candidatus Micrarchaeota archaeon]|nr:PHP domain-containing protein [Candidatus Micrarchaeota archaeon]